MCSTSGSITLTEPSTVQFSFSNLQNATCFKKKDGSVNLNISGGLGNFSVVWDNGSFSMNPDDLGAGYNEVRIYEQGRAIIDTGITLTQPDAIDIQFAYSDYNGFNVSCVDCYNGSVTTTVTGGVAPYTYFWEDANNSATANLSNLNGGEYTLNVTDANGCKTSNTAQLTMPAPKDWSRFGNANIDTSQFIGSTDTSAVVFKSNNQESLRLMGNGNVRVSSSLQLKQYALTAPIGSPRVAAFNDQGVLVPMGGNPINLDEETPDPQTHLGCEENLPLFPWQNPASYSNSNNTLVSVDKTCIVTCPSVRVGICLAKPRVGINLEVAGRALIRERLGIGSALIPSAALDVYGDMKINGKGYIAQKLGINVVNPTEELEVNGTTILNGNVRIGNANSTAANYTRKLVVEGIVYSREFRVTDVPVWPDFVFAKTHKLISLPALKLFIEKESHLPGIPNAQEIKESGGFSIDEMIVKLLQKQEETTLYLIQLNEKIAQLEKENQALKAAIK